MASNFVGLSVAVTLQSPPGAVVLGVVSGVDQHTATLTLQDVFFPNSGHRVPSYNVEGHMIADIKVAPSAPAPPQPLPPRSEPHAYSQYPQNHVQRPPPYIGQRIPHVVSQPSSIPSVGASAYQNARQAPHQPAPQPTPAAPFVDPAILSMGKRTSTAPSLGPTVAAPPQEAPATPIKSIAAASAAALPKNTSPFVGHGKKNSVRKPSAATLEGPFSSLDIAYAEEADSETRTGQVAARRASITKTRTGKPMDDPSPQKNDDGGKKTRRGGKSRKKELAAQERKNGDVETVKKGKGNGWRNTPMLQAAEQSQARTPGVIGGKVGLAAANASNRKTKRQQALEATNGWATEDATDIQDMPEFDFQGNLSKFDKRTVFNQIRNEDTTADEDRLVSFNRLARPGTHGGKNLHPTENVLDRKLKSTTNTSSEEEEVEFGSGRNSRRAMSRASVKRAPTRQGSGVQADLDMMGSGVLPRTNRSFVLNRPYASSHATGSPRPGRVASPPESPLESSAKGCLRLVSNNRKCFAITPGAMLAVEETAEIEFGLGEDLMAENSGRGIAEVALTAINPGGRRLARDNPNANPVIVVLAGNHRGGARAVAAARHLAQRGPKVMVALLGFERNADWDKDIRRQVELFRKFGGSVRAWKDTEEALKRLQAPPELIIDALLGRHKEFEALGDEDQRVVLNIVGWANKSRAACLAVETPSGVGGSTGEVSILEGEPLEVRAKYIVCLGAPRTGLVKALQNGAGRDPQWLIWIVDIGVNRPWRNAGISGGKGIKFGEQWVVQAQFEEPSVMDGGRA